MALLATKLATDLGAGVRIVPALMTVPCMEEEEPLGRYLEGGALALETGARKRESFTTGPELDRSDLGGGPAHAPLVMGMLDLEETEEMECVCEMAEEGVPLEELMCECCVVMGGAFEAIGGGQAHCDDMVPVARGTWTRGCDAEVTGKCKAPIPG